MSSLSSEQLKELKRSVLLDKLAYLCEELGDPGRYFPELRSKHVLDVTDTDVIKSKLSEREKTTEFVTIVSKRSASNGQHGLDVLVEALRKQRVHAHVARTLTRAVNKKKAEAERSCAPLDGATQHVAGTSPPSRGNSLAPDPPQLHPTDSLPHTQTPTSDISTSSSQLDMHPKHGLLPPNPPPPSAPDNSFSDPVDGIDGDTHPQHGLRPPHPPPTPSNGSYIAPQQEVTSLDTPSYPAAPNGGYAEASNSQCSDELGPQSMGDTETTMSSMSMNDTSYSTGDFEKVLAPPGRVLSSSSAASRSSYHSVGSGEDHQSAELDRLRKEIDQLRRDKIHLHQMVTGLQHENSLLREQLTHQRPSNLQFMQPHPPPYHYSPGHRMDYNSLTPSSRNPALRPRNPSPSPGGEREFAMLRPANSSGSLNSYSSKGSYTPSESQV